MSRAFKVIPAKPTFGTLSEVVYQSDYLEVKKARALCKKPRIPYICDKTDLVVGQYLKMNLNGVDTVSDNNIEPNSRKPFYEYNTIDPMGELFGNTQCGELNYTEYFRLFPNTVTNY